MLAEEIFYHQLKTNKCKQNILSLTLFETILCHKCVQFINYTCIC